MPIGQLILFIDQLERTFESGDQPDSRRLRRSRRSLVDLLKTVGTDKGVRVFIASRKQYLPDFLGSSRAAAAAGLEFNVLQTITDEPERCCSSSRSWTGASKTEARRPRR